MFTVLNERDLYIDGDSVITDLNFIYNKILNNQTISNVFVEEITKEIENFNSDSEYKLTKKTKLNKLDTNWNLPLEYKSIDLYNFINLKFEQEIADNNLSDIEIDIRLDRINLELELFKKYKVENLLKTVIFIVDKFKEHNIVWGTGRGSSCCCYILYLIGLHDVDSIKYELDIGEFFR